MQAFSYDLRRILFHLIDLLCAAGSLVSFYQLSLHAQVLVLTKGVCQYNDDTVEERYM